MPTYQYRCTECDDLIEAVQKFTDPALTECPHCKGKLRKVFNAVGIVFKGSGFYATDSRGKSSVTASKPAETKTDKPATKVEPKAESKPAATPSSTTASKDS